MSEELKNEQGEINADNTELSREEQEKKYFAMLAEQKKTDPLIGVSKGSEDIFKSLMMITRDDKGVVNIHDVTLYAAGLAGYACQAVCVETNLIRDKKQFNELFHLIVTPKGEKYIFGDCINEYLFTSNHSVWNLVLGMYKHMYTSLKAPSPAGHIKKVVESLGNPDYMVCGEYKPEALVDMLGLVWKNLAPKMSRYCPNPEEWPVLYAMVLQKVLGASKGVIDPNISMNFIAEMLVFSSKMYLN